MRIELTDAQGNPAEAAVGLRLHNLLQRVRASGRLIQDGLKWTVKNHFQTIYPGSKHYSPDKVTPLDAKDGPTPEGSVDIDVPGVTRAYKNLDIRPRFRKFLAIPMHREAYGKKPADFSDLFVVRKKDSGKAYLAQKAPGGTGITFMFSLVKRAFQPRDSRLMPSDQTLADNVFARIGAYLDRVMRN